MGFNPANWKITNTFQGQRGGFDLNPWNTKVSPAVGSTVGRSGYMGVSVSPQPSVAASTAGTTAKAAPTGQVNGASTTNPSWLTGSTLNGRNSSGYYNDYTADEVNNLNSQLSQTDRLLASLGLTRDTGITNIGREYEKNVGQAQEGQSQFNRDLNIRRDDNSRNKENSLNRINTDAENKYNSVMRMLGIRGAGVSSAAQMVAPDLISKNATNQRADQFDTFGRNQRGIDVAQGDSDLKYTNLFEDLLAQKNQKENEFRQSMVNQESDLYGTRANNLAQLDSARGGTGAAAYQDYNNKLAANQVTLDDLVRAYQTPQYQVKPVDTAAPNLDQYTADPLAVAVGADGQPVEDNSVYLPWLQRKQKLGLY